MKQVSVTYDDRSVRWFVIATVVWALAALTFGVWAAVELATPAANLPPWFSFGRLRPLHTNAAIFAFVGNMMFAGIYYSSQRLLKTRMASDALTKIHFWGWQLIIVLAAVTLPLGITQGKEYAELEWPIDILVTLVWVVFAINFFWTLAIRREKHLYVAIWFYIATILTVAMLYVVNNLALPVLSGVKSYSIYSGVQDALVQWWYGHNAVAFFLTTPILGIMYYFLPKAAERPVYSYRLSIVHFWALVFIYIWAGPHHLLYTALPDWAQSLGMVFSLMLWAPSWGGMLNGLLTLRGAWDKLRTDPVIKFLIAGVTFYGMSTFEGPLLSIKSVSALGHYTDWIIGHVHNGTLGWNGLMAAGMLYWLVPRLWGTKLYSVKAANFHFWIATIGILLYAVSMWVSGITQGLMWRATDESGALLYPSFLEMVVQSIPLYWTRALGGTLFLTGFIMLAWNLWKTAKSGKPVDVTVTVTEPEPEPKLPWRKVIFSYPLVLTYMGLITMMMFFASGPLFAVVAGVLMLAIFIAVWLSFGARNPEWKGVNFHRILEGRALIFSVLTFLAVAFGGIVELVPTLMVDRAVPMEQAKLVEPYTPLELHGRDIYIREGCYVCHSQMVRPFVSEVVRYRGGPSRPEDSVWDHPFQWGSKRTGPDLGHIGKRNAGVPWHYMHLMDPGSTSDGKSIMPSYPFLAEQKIDTGDTALKLSAMQTLGVPYSNEEIANGVELARAQGTKIAEELATQGIQAAWDDEMVALIAYLECLGKKTPPEPKAVAKRSSKVIRLYGAPAPAGQ